MEERKGSREREREIGEGDGRLVGPAGIIAPPPIPEAALRDVSALSYLGLFPILLSGVRVRASWLSASVGRPTPTEAPPR
jgi:hypothetical protein